MRIPRLHKEISLFSRDEKKSIGTALRLLADRISLVVTGDSTSSSLTITEGAMEAITGQLTIKGSDGTTTVVEGGSVKAESIKADDIDVDSITIGQSQVADLDDALEAAAATAENYITRIDNDGIWVTPDDAKPVSGQAAATTSGWHISDAIDLVREGISVMRAWAEGTAPDVVAKLRIGPETDSNVLVEPSGVSLRSAATVVAKFAASLIEIGKGSTSALISFCNSKGYIYYDTTNGINLSSTDSSSQAGASMSASSSSTDAKVRLFASRTGADTNSSYLECRNGSNNGNYIKMNSAALMLADNGLTSTGTQVQMRRFLELFNGGDDVTELSLASSAKAYNNDYNNTPVCRKCGRVVSIRGVVSPTSNHAADSDMSFNICGTNAIPSDCRPPATIHTICQGSGASIWLLQVNANGSITGARFRDNNGWRAIDTNTWLPFNVTYVI